MVSWGCEPSAVPTLSGRIVAGQGVVDSYMMAGIANTRQLGVLAIAVPVVAIVSALAACQADVLVTVDEEREATIVISLGVSDSLAEFAGIEIDDILGGGLDALGIDDDDGTSDAEGSEGVADGIFGFLEDVGDNQVTRYEEDGYSGYRITQTLAASEIESNLSEVEGITALADLVPEFQFRRTDSDDGWILSGELELGAAIDDLAGGEMAEGFGGLFGMALEQFDATLRVRLPGDVLESTAHRTEDGAEVWDLFDPEGASIYLVSREPTDFQIAPWLIAAGIGVLVLGIIWQVRLRRR